MHLKYQHDGSQESGDEFTLMITDGVHKLEQISHVKVMPLKDEQPQVTKNAGLKVQPQVTKNAGLKVLNVRAFVKNIFESRSY